MRKLLIVLLLSVLSITACRKDTQPSTTEESSFNLLKEVTEENILSLSQDQIKSVVHFLDTCSAAEKDHFYALFKKANELRTTTKPTSSSTNLKAADDIDYSQYTQLNYYPDGNADPYSALFTQTGVYGITAFYNWTVAYSSIGFYSVQSKERLELADSGPAYENSGIRYSIQQLGHAASYIVGIAPGLSWAETSNFQYGGIYTAYFTISGVVSAAAIGWNVPLATSRYVSVAVVVATGGINAY